MLDMLWPYLVMLASAFGAATLLPFSSEVVLIAGLKSGFALPSALIAVAAVGNVGSSTFNWWLGRYARHFEGRRWFPFEPAAIDRAAVHFRRLGLWSLMLAWLPVVGDPLTFIAGVLRVPLPLFLPLVAIGKLGRYLALAWAV